MDWKKALKITGVVILISVFALIAVWAAFNWKVIISGSQIYTSQQREEYGNQRYNDALEQSEKWRVQVQELQETITVYEDELKTLEEEKSTLEAQIQQKDGEITEKKQEIIKLQQQITTLTNNIKELNEELSKFKKATFINVSDTVTEVYTINENLAYIPSLPQTKETWFYGWSEEPGSNEIVDFTSYDLTENKTFYAVTGKTAKITFEYYPYFESNSYYEYFYGENLYLRDVLIPNNKLKESEDYFFRFVTDSGLRPATDKISLDTKICEIPDDFSGGYYDYQKQIKSYRIAFNIRWQKEFNFINDSLATSTYQNNLYKKDAKMNTPMSTTRICKYDLYVPDPKFVKISYTLGDGTKQELDLPDNPLINYAGDYSNFRYEYNFNIPELGDTSLVFYFNYIGLYILSDFCCLTYTNYSEQNLQLSFVIDFQLAFSNVSFLNDFAHN